MELPHAFKCYLPTTARRHTTTDVGVALGLFWLLVICQVSPTSPFLLFVLLSTDAPWSIFFFSCFHLSNMRHLEKESQDFETMGEINFAFTCLQLFLLITILIWLIMKFILIIKIKINYVYVKIHLIKKLLLLILLLCCSYIYFYFLNFKHTFDFYRVVKENKNKLFVVES